MRKKLIQVSGFALLSMAVSLAFTACRIVNTAPTNSGPTSARIFDFHKEDCLLQTAVSIIPRVEDLVSHEIAQEMRLDGNKRLVLFASSDVWFYEAGGWRLYFDEYLNLKNIQYYHASTTGHEGMRLMADVNNRQVDWEFEGISSHAGLKPHLATTANVYDVSDVLVSKLALAVNGIEVTSETILTKKK